LETGKSNTLTLKEKKEKVKNRSRLIQEQGGDTGEWKVERGTWRAMMLTLAVLHRKSELLRVKSGFLKN
jgi:hypothetical protein